MIQAEKTLKVPVKTLSTLPFSWNMDGYVRQSIDSTHLYSLDLPPVLASSDEDDYVLVYIQIDGRYVVGIISDLDKALSGSRRGRTIEVRCSLLNGDYSQPPISACWSSASRMFYVLHQSPLFIHRFAPALVLSKEEPRIQPSTIFPLELPSELEATLESKVAVLSRISSRPELLDPYIFISFPKSGAIWEIALSNDTVRLPGESHKIHGQRGGERQKKKSPSEPSGLWSDSATERLFILDRISQQAYTFSRPGTLEVVGQVPDAGPSTSIAIYRLSKYTDPALLSAAPRASHRDEPTLLLYIGARNRVLFKLLLGAHRLEPVILRLPAGLELDHLHILPSGSLLVTTATEGTSLYISTSSTRGPQTFHSDQVS